MDNRITGLPDAAVTIPYGGIFPALPPECPGRRGTSGTGPFPALADHGWGGRGVGVTGGGA